MRKVGDFSSERAAANFLERLQDDNITALIEEDEGKYIVWVHEEKDVDKARNIYQNFDSKEEDVKPNTSKSHEQGPKEEQTSYTPYSSPPNLNTKKKNVKNLAVAAFFTRILFSSCAVIFFIGMYQMATQKDKTNSILSLPAVAKALVIDYPEKHELLNEIIERYGIERVQNNTLPDEAAPLVQKHNTSIPWVGFYNYFLLPKEEKEVFFQGQFLRNVRAGEVWRLFTPAILHTGLLHILFNMLWLMLLGRMVEFNMGVVRFPIFVLLTAVISNLCQYIMSGPYFMGISGVLSAFIGYILVRKKIAPWEPYFIGKETLNFFLIFVFGFFVLQVTAFVLQVTNVYSIPLFIANTAHLSGLFSGMIFAKTGLFAKKLV